ncbi:MAG: hypothetical protein U5J64_03735 [Halobacteriales archaeon]|nr:hypothetical protein [Halobacteriales archaeon]
MGRTTASAISDDETEDGTTGFYIRAFGKPRFPEEAYGYWISVTGASLVLVGVLFLLLGTTVGRVSPLFWTARQVAVVLAGSGVPLLVLGFVYRLPVSEGVYRTAVVGTVVCLLALAVFVRFYPDGWNVQPGSPATDRSSQVTAVYAFGFLLVVFSATVLPVMAEKRDEVVEDGTPDSDARFEIFRDVSADWRWLLRDADGRDVVDSETGYTTEMGAERSVEYFRDEVEGASVETRDVLEEYLRSGETPVVEERDSTQPAIGASDAEAEDERERISSRFEVYEDEEGARWRLLGPENEVLAVSSRCYTSRSDAEDAFETLRDAGDADVHVADADSDEVEETGFLVHRTADGGWAWRFVDSGGRELAVGGDEEILRN